VSNCLQIVRCDQNIRYAWGTNETTPPPLALPGARSLFLAPSLAHPPSLSRAVSLSLSLAHCYPPPRSPKNPSPPPVSPTSNRYVSPPPPTPNPHSSGNGPPSPGDGPPDGPPSSDSSPSASKSGSFSRWIPSLDPLRCSPEPGVTLSASAHAPHAT